MVQAPEGPLSNVLVLIGTRPEAIKMFPVVHALRNSHWFVPVVVTTGQHRDLVAPILELASIEPDFDLDVGRPGLTLNDLASTVIERLDAFLRDRYGATGTDVATREQVRTQGFPVASLVHGDTSSAVAAALASFHLRIPVVHVEAGLRTHSTLSPFPEELNRQLIARIAAFHLSPTTVNKESLVLEGIGNERVFVTGNTGLDALRFAATLELPIEEPAVHEENWNGGLARIADAVGQLAARHADVRFVVPLHPNPLVRRELGEPLADHPNVLLSEPLAYAQFARLLARATLVITDSGGIQEEAPALGVPVLVTRDSTERDEGVDAGVLTLVGTEPSHIVAVAEAILADPASHVVDPSSNPYGDGRASERLVAALEFLAGIGPPPERFGPGFSRRAVLQAAGYGSLLDEPREPRNTQPERHEEHDVWVGR